MNFESPKKPENRGGVETPERTRPLLNLIEVKQGEEGYETALPIAKRDSDTRTIEEIVRDALQYKYWFLRDYWKDKKITEKLRVEIEGGAIDIYNFNEALQDEHKRIITDTLKDYARYQTGVLGKVNTILIDNEQYLNENTGKPLNGRGGQVDRAIKLYPAALEGDHRMPGINNLEGTIIHELSHSISVELRNKWAKEFDWEELETPEYLPGGAKRNQAPRDPSRCVTEYATVSVAEDVCESMVAFMKNEKLLDKDKLKFLQDNFPARTEGVGEVSLHSQGNLRIPELEQPVRYKLVTPKTFSVNN